MTACVWRSSLVSIVTLIVCVATNAQPANEQPTITQQPSWKTSFPAAIEWVEPIAPASNALLVALRDGRVRLLRTSDGRTLLDLPDDAVPGVRYAGAVAGRAYLYDARSVFCIAVDSPPDASSADRPRVVWSRTIIAPRVRTNDSDPEFQTRLVAAAATPDGVLTVDSEGVVLLLAGCDGATRWDATCPRSRTVRVLTAASSAVVYIEGGPRPGCLLIELGMPTPQSRWVELPALRVLHARLSRDALAIAATDRMVVVDANAGTISTHDYGASDATPSVMNSRIFCAAELLGEAPDAADSANSRAPSPFLCVAGRDFLCYDMASGKIARRQRVSELVTPWRDLSASAGRVLLVSENSVCLVSLSPSPIAYALPLPETARVADARLNDARIHVLAECRPLTPNAPPAHVLCIYRITESAPGLTTPVQTLADAPQDPIAIRWTANRVLLIARDRIAAYTLGD